VTEVYLYYLTVFLKWNSKAFTVRYRMEVEQHVQEFPRLARMARQHLAVPATSASPERLFSSVGFVKSDLWDRLLDRTLIE
jgi:hypothetical protein